MDINNKNEQVSIVAKCSEINRTWEWLPLKPHWRQWKDETNQQNYEHINCFNMTSL